MSNFSWNKCSEAHIQILNQQCSENVYKSFIHANFGYYAVNWYVSRLNGRDTMDVIFFHITSQRINI